MKYYLNLVLLIVPSFLPAQVDTAFVRISKENTVALYEAAIGKQSLLYNGTEYLEPKQTNDDHPFFEKNDWVKGSVSYDGHFFENVYLMYDITGQQVITESLQGHLLSLVPEKLDGFTLGEKKFTRIQTDSAFAPRQGFYEVIFDSNDLSFYAFHKKNTVSRLEQSKEEIYFEYRVKYFGLHNGTLMPIRGKRSLYKLLPKEKNALRKFLRERELKFSRQNDDILRQVGQFYETKTQ